MSNAKDIFKKHQAQTFPSPSCLEVESANGSYITDVNGKQYLDFPAEIQKGIVLQRAIDTFTDTHPIVSKSVERLFDRYGHYSRVIVDILYDHFLAANWKEYCEIPLKEYTEDFYKLLKDNYEVLPKTVQNFLLLLLGHSFIAHTGTLTYKSNWSGLLNCFQILYYQGCSMPYFCKDYEAE